MLELRIHGRGGQGAVIASEVLANAFFFDGQSVQTFPEFGVERRGAPVAAYVRVDKKPVRIRCRVTQPHHIVVLDPVLLTQVNVTLGLKPKGWILINSEKKPKDIDLPNAEWGMPKKASHGIPCAARARRSVREKFRIATVNATQIAIKYGLGPRTAPIVNTAILGAFCKLGMFRLKSLEKAITQIIPIKTDKNLEATREAYETIIT